jgi:hypothetical protein
MTEHNTVQYYKLSLGCYLQSVVVKVLCNPIDMFSYFQVVTSDQWCAEMDMFSVQEAATTTLYVLGM